jgi:PAS domain S-box-containing protein
MTQASDRESLAAAVVHSSLDGLAVLDRDTRYVLWNPTMERFTGKTAAEVLGQNAFAVFPFLRELGLDVAMQRVLRGEVVATAGVEHVESDGTRKVYDRVYMPLRVGGGDVSGVIAIVRDATVRYAEQDTLRTTEAKLLMAAEAAGIGLWTWDPALDVITWENTLCTLYGRAPGDVPKDRDGYLALVHPEDRKVLRDRIARGVEEGHWEHEYRIIRPDGTVRWLASRTRRVTTERNPLVLGAVYDITERKEADDRLRAAQRLEVVGQLTAGIAHNFNNLLMGILPNLQLAARAAPKELLPLIRDAERSTLRAADVVRELMTYAGRGRSSTRGIAPVAPLVERTVAFCRTTFDRAIDLTVDCKDAVAALIDASQIEQAILNLLINARDAVAGTSVPAIAAVCERVFDGPELDGRAGEWVAIRVTDNGIGMDATTIHRMYEPFFTTKPAGSGTGLGLATTQSIVRNHGGFLVCRSAPGHGTSFSLYLPASNGTAPSVSEPASEPLAAHARKQTVLVVDDDPQVRTAVARILEAEGFGVDTAATGEDGLARIADPRNPRISLVLLDVSMPGMSGPQMRRRLRDSTPELPVVFLTGYPFEPEHADPVLSKPVTAEVLVARIDEILTRNRA